MLLVLHSALTAVFLKPFCFYLLLISMDNKAFIWYKQEADHQVVFASGLCIVGFYELTAASLVWLLCTRHADRAMATNLVPNSLLH